jgi:molybdenum cofactor guanylyltransferase
MYNDVTGIILSGGKSSRMGTNKSLLKLGNETVIEIIHKVLSELFPRVIIITNDIITYEFINCEKFGDIKLGYGPLSGIHSGLINSKTDKNFIISCDVPLISKKIIEFIVDYPGDHDIVVPFADNHIQTLCGMYHKNILNEIESIFLSNSEIKSCKVKYLLDKTRSKIIEIEKELPDFDKNTFMNMNNMVQYLLVQYISETRSK